MKSFIPTIQSGERVVRMGRERSGKELVKGGRKEKTHRGLEFSRQGLPKIYPPIKEKIDDSLKRILKRD